MDLRYKLGLITHKYQLTHRNLADGYPHYINITRHNRTIKSQVGALQVLVISTALHLVFPQRTMHFALPLRWTTWSQ